MKMTMQDGEQSRSLFDWSLTETVYWMHSPKLSSPPLL